MRNLLIALSLLTGTVTVLAFFPEPSAISAPTPPPEPHQSLARPVVEVAFVLDTTGSMGGMIAAAKDKIWSIASTLAKGHPTPEIRVALVAFRDRGDAYVSKVHDLTADLDRMYVELMGLQAAGGGDGPEAVATALSDAINQLSWTRQEQAYRAIFLVGDAPAHTDRPGEPRLDQLIADASDLDIVVNTIQCGDDAQTQDHWSRIARWGSGQYIKVDQSGGALVLATPFDERLAHAASELDKTRIYFGDANAQRRARQKQHDAATLDAGAPMAARARRAIFNASSGGEYNFAGDNELVDAFGRGEISIESVPTDQLPTSLRSLSPQERVVAVNRAAARRASLLSEIRSLTGQRSAYIDAELQSDRADASQSLDQQVFETVRGQAAQKGISYEEVRIDY